ncbi:putative FAD dependent oxidoreductase [Rosellinia necatrix]|uniref:Putative FAD dependent oxidoreductase n=1 Tax=Rosellinia necatrix TaxID=77044 RepID=A0A1W2TI62_ROSNE|nr:putative FAD dependent oxidoreductase [Rosellinia necatrix]
MKIFVTASLPSFHVRASQSTYFLFSDVHSDLLTPLTGPQAVDVWICNGEEVTGDLVERWVSQAPHVPKSMLVENAATIPRLQEYAKGRVAEVAGFPQRLPNVSAAEWEESVVRNAEMLYARARANAGTRRVSVNGTERHARETTVLLVGAGIMNLMTARVLAEQGYRVRVVDQGPDPRSCQDKDWTCLGVTSGGHNARMFTNTEADSYNEQDSELYQDMQSIFRKSVRNGGWSVKLPEQFTAAEHAWVSAFERVPGWMAAAFKKNIHEVNVESGKIWKELMSSVPQLFEDVGFRKDIIRLYAESVAVDASIQLNRKLGALLQTPPLPEFLKEYPGFRDAAKSDALAGALTVDGFTVNVHLFMAKLLDYITALGGEFIWNCEVQSIQRDANGVVSTLTSNKGKLEADHFVVSPGTTGNALLKGTACENLIHGVLGIWLQIPNVELQIRHSMKIHRRGHKVEDINVTVAKDKNTGEDILIFGGAYGYVGLGRPAPDSPEMDALYAELEEVARIYFPKGYAAAKKRGPTCMYPGGYRKYCVRPFTPTGLGVFEKIPTARGGQLIITGGNNTGGFAQAPAVARAVLRSFMGEHDPIHVLFHPDRGKQPRPVGGTLPLLGGQAMGAGARQPLKLLLLCSDGPQHRYLRYRADQAFPGYRCIQETSNGQIRELWNKGRIADACWQRYHGLRRTLLGHDVQRKAYFDDMVPQDYVLPEPDLVVSTVNCSDVWDAVEKWEPDLTIVSGTKFIGKKLIARGGLMINLHTGYLPEYKGNHCIFFALYDGATDKVASTLHQLTSSLDGGAILDRVFPPILPTDTEETLYTKCLAMSMDKCMEYIERVSRGEQLDFLPQQAQGRTFRHRDRTPLKELRLWLKSDAKAPWLLSCCLLATLVVAFALVPTTR